MRVPVGYRHADWSFKCLSPSGMLIAYRRANGDGGFLFMPTSGGSPHLVVLNPKNKIAKFVERPHVLIGGKRAAHYGVLELRDMDGDGDVVFSKRVGGKAQHERDPVWCYLKAFGAKLAKGRWRHGPR